MEININTYSVRYDYKDYKVRLYFAQGLVLLKILAFLKVFKKSLWIFKDLIMHEILQYVKTRNSIFNFENG